MGANQFVASNKIKKQVHDEKVKAVSDINVIVSVVNTEEC